MTQEDLDDIEKRMPFTMTIDDLPFYNVKYLGQQQEDELNCYVFDLSPKKIDKGQRYFEGRIWVDDHDFQIVKTYGKNVPDLVKAKKGEENLFPRFTTWREQIDGKYWFPTYTKVDDNLHFTHGRCPHPPGGEVRKLPPLRIKDQESSSRVRRSRAQEPEGEPEERAEGR